MSAPALAGRPSLRIRGTHYPVLLPTVRDPRLHLAAVIITLQVLGQVAFDFQLSIAQILVSLAVAGILEVAITFRTQRVLMWPASALLTGNGVAFVLRVPGTEHGDWWSMNGWWIFAGTSAVALLSKYAHPRARATHLQPLELRARALLPPSGRAARGSAGAVVGTALPRARLRHRTDRRRRVPHPAGGCTSSGSPSASGSHSRPGSACSPRAATR